MRTERPFDTHPRAAGICDLLPRTGWFLSLSGGSRHVQRVLVQAKSYFGQDPAYYCLSMLNWFDPRMPLRYHLVGGFARRTVELHWTWHLA